jgi:hypothetical protein
MVNTTLKYMVGVRFKRVTKLAECPVNGFPRAVA